MMPNLFNNFTQNILFRKENKIIEKEKYREEIVQHQNVN